MNIFFYFTFSANCSTTAGSNWWGRTWTFRWKTDSSSIVYTHQHCCLERLAPPLHPRVAQVSTLKKLFLKHFHEIFPLWWKRKQNLFFFSRQLKFQSCTWKSDIKIGVFDVTNRLVLNFFLTLFSILELTNSSSSGVSMQALRLLVNLSTNPPMIEYLQSADVSHDKSSKYFYRLNKAL